jgi:hypothetical protein
MAWIKLTYLPNNQRKALYLNTDQIVRITEALGDAKGYATNVTLVAGTQDVCETIDEVMKLIEPKEPPAVA